MFLLLATLIGTQPYCTVNLDTQKIECNYENIDACLMYREENELCIANPNLK